MKKIFRKIHIYASIFFLPMALLFSITGILYICGINQDYKIQKQQFEIIQKGEVENIGDFTLNFLKENNLALPSKTEVKFNKKMGGYTMGSTGYFITIVQKPNLITITTNKRSFIGNAIMLHKAKVAQPFVIFSIIFGIALLLFYFSGFIMTSWCKQHRKEGIIFLILGIATTSIIAIISL